MVLRSLQAWLADFYALDLAYHVDDFLITDERLARALDRGGRGNEEKLLIAEEDGEAAISLYLQQDLVDRLVLEDPTTDLNERNLGDFWTACEGVSHFVYYVFCATQDRSLTLLEMELQAEVDKFVATAALLRRQGSRLPTGLHDWLFTRSRLVDELSSIERERYACASRYAGKYCLKLLPGLTDRSRWPGLQRELRHFYRLSRSAKLGHIEAA